MATKRKSDTLVSEEDWAILDAAQCMAASGGGALAKKKARTVKPVADEEKENVPNVGSAKPVERMRDVELPTDEDDDLMIFDDCNEIRRKIRLLLKQPNFKITHWLKEIGGINSNSYGRFMKLSGPQGGAENSIYPAAYEYFEKVRIAEGKKKTAKRKRNEEEHPYGLSMRGAHRGYWVIGPARR